MEGLCDFCIEHHMPEQPKDQENTKRTLASDSTDWVMRQALSDAKQASGEAETLGRRGCRSGHAGPRLASLRREAHHRGYRIEGETKGEGLILRVTPMRESLPNLPCSRFRTIRAPWAKAVTDVAKYIDEALTDSSRPNEKPASESARSNEEIHRLRSLLRAELKRRRAELASARSNQ